jgi:flavin-dependent dehydrogenase
MSLILVAFISIAWAIPSLAQTPSKTYDIIVVGAPPGGIAAALTAARFGRGVHVAGRDGGHGSPPVADEKRSPITVERQRLAAHPPLCQRVYEALLR